MMLLQKYNINILYLRWICDVYHIPVIFFTVQKSIDRSRITITKLVMKLLPNNSHRIYTTTADTLKARWKNVTYGCLKCNETWEIRFFYQVLPVFITVIVQTITWIFRQLYVLQTFMTRDKCMKCVKFYHQNRNY